MFLTRLISGIVLLALAILTISLNGPVLFVTLLVVSLIGMLELYRAVGIRRKRENILTIVCYAGATAYYILMYAGMSSYYLAAIALVMTAILFVYVFSFPKYHAEDIMAAFFGVVYVAVCLSFIFQTRNLPDGQWLVWLIFLCSWGCDTMAYCTGRLFGRHKMAPVLSPKKSVEGAVGGVVFAALFGAIYAIIIERFASPAAGRVFVYAIICAAGALISMVGDLAASAIKRNHKIKDYGKLIPGHGGILDRFDSVIITAPVIYTLALALT